MARPEREAIAPASGPRFALSFEDGRGLLSLAKPLRCSFGTIEALELGLGELSFPLDLTGGAARFRTRRTRVRKARVVVDVPAIAPDRLVALAPLAEGMAWALTDAFGTIAFDTAIRAEGCDLFIALGSARAATDGPAPPLLRAFAAAQANELELDAERGAFCVRRPLSALLMHALVPYGWRIPDDRNARIAIEILGRRRAVLRTLDEGEAEPSFDAEPFERARRLAPVIAALSSGDREGARRAWDGVRERLREVPEALAREARSLAVDPSERADHPVGLSLALRAALRARDGIAAARAARALAELEPCDTVAVEGLCAAAELVDRSLAAELLERARARKPRDARVALRLIEALAQLDRSDALRASIDAALAAREPGPDRGALAREAALVCELADRLDEAARLVRVAAGYLPNDAKVLAALAVIEERTGGDEAALRAWDRVADACDDEDDRRHALRRAARAAERMGRLEIAEERLSRAEGDPLALAALARARRNLGAIEAALRAEDALLDHAQGGEVADEVAAALLAAARAALAGDAIERARTFASALARSRPSHAGLSSLREELDARDVGVWAEHPDRLLALHPERIASALATLRDPSALRAIAERLGATGAAALARAHAAAIERDTASLRAALAAAERAGDRDSARAIVELALSVVGEGPARRMLEAARDRLRSE